MKLNDLYVILFIILFYSALDLFILQKLYFNVGYVYLKHGFFIYLGLTYVNIAALIVRQNVHKTLGGLFSIHLLSIFFECCALTLGFGAFLLQPFKVPLLLGAYEFSA